MNAVAENVSGEEIERPTCVGTHARRVVRFVVFDVASGASGSDFL
jgi:hypothetical protein